MTERAVESFSLTGPERNESAYLRIERIVAANRNIHTRTDGSTALPYEDRSRLREFSRIQLYAEALPLLIASVGC